jgi:hypothetical protein
MDRLVHSNFGEHPSRDAPKEPLFLCYPPVFLERDMQLDYAFLPGTEPISRFSCKSLFTKIHDIIFTTFSLTLDLK